MTIIVQKDFFNQQTKLCSLNDFQICQKEVMNQDMQNIM